MDNPDTENQENTPEQSALLRLRVAMSGLAQDFWNDGDEWPAFLSFLPHAKKKKVDSVEEAGEAPKEEAPVPIPEEEKKWKADRIHILQKLWGDNHVIPGDEAYWTNITAPMGLNREMSVLDLSAGLGGFARFIAEEYGSYVSGMEADQLFAARGMILSIAAGKSKHASVTPYDPSVYSASRKYDCVIARDLFYRIVGKEAFFDAVNESLKNGGGQLVFTDFLLDPAERNNPAIQSWIESEEDAAPLSSVEMIKVWKGMGYDVRVTEDQTEDYKVFIIKGLARFVEFASRQKIEKGTKLVILDEIERWAKIYMALNEGLRYYRIYAIKR